MDLMLKRDRFLFSQEYDASDLRLATHDTGAYDSFIELALRTFDLLAETEFRPWTSFSYEPESAGFFLFDRKAAEALKRTNHDVWFEWVAWSDGFADFCTRNPAIELKVLLHELSERHDATSFPCGYEADIQEWVDYGHGESPLPYRSMVDWSDLHTKLKSVRQRLKGWIYFGDDSLMHFAPEDEWQKIRGRFYRGYYKRPE
jgi:hypothetical protein